MPLSGRAIWRILGIALTIISLVTVGWFAHAGLRSGFDFSQARMLPLAGAMVVQLLVLALTPLLWVRVLRIFCDPNILQHQGAAGKIPLYKAFTRSWLARYIPGRIWMFGGRMLLVSQLGMPAKAVLSSMYYEFAFSYGMLTVVGTALIVGLLVHPTTGLIVLLTGAVLVVGGILIPHRVVSRLQTPEQRGYFIQRFHKLLAHVMGVSVNLSYRQAIWGSGAYGLHAVLQMVFIILVATSFVDVSIGQAAAIAGVWALSGVLGYLAFFSSAGGLGVRDGMALALLSQSLDPSSAALIIVTTRILMIIADLVFVGGMELVAQASSFRNILANQH